MQKLLVGGGNGFSIITVYKYLIVMILGGTTMSKMKTRRMIFAIVLSLCMVVTMMPAMVWAADPQPDPAVNYQKGIDFYDEMGRINQAVAFYDDPTTLIDVTAKLDKDIFDLDNSSISEYGIAYGDPENTPTILTDYKVTPQSQKSAFTLSYDQIQALYNSASSLGCSDSTWNCADFLIYAKASFGNNQSVNKYIQFSIYGESEWDIYVTDQDIFPAEDPCKIQKASGVRREQDGKEFDANITSSTLQSGSESWLSASSDNDYYIYTLTNKNVEDNTQATLDMTINVVDGNSTITTLNHTIHITAQQEQLTLACDFYSAILFGEDTILRPILEYKAYDKQNDEIIYEIVSEDEALNNNAEYSIECISNNEPQWTSVNEIEHGKWKFTANQYDINIQYPDEVYDEYKVTVTYRELTTSDSERVVLSMRDARVESKTNTTLYKLVSGTSHDTIYASDFIAYECWVNDDGTIEKKQHAIDTVDFIDVIPGTYTKEPGKLILKRNQEHEDCYTYVAVRALLDDNSEGYGSFSVLINPTAKLIVPKRITMDIGQEKEIDVVANGDVTYRITKGTIKVSARDGKLVIQPQEIGHSEIELTVPETEEFKARTETISIDVVQNIAETAGASIKAASDKTASNLDNTDSHLSLDVKKSTESYSIEAEKKVPVNVVLKNQGTEEAVNGENLIIKLKADDSVVDGLGGMLEGCNFNAQCIDNGKEGTTPAWIEVDAAGDYYICFETTHLSNYVLTGSNAKPLGEYSLILTEPEYESPYGIITDSVVGKYGNTVANNAFTLKFIKTDEATVSPTTGAKELDASEIETAGWYFVKAVAVVGKGYCGETACCKIKITKNKEDYPEYNIEEKQNKNGGGVVVVPTDEETFAAEKTTAIAVCNALAEANKDSKYPYIAELIDKAKKDIEATTFDKTKTLAENEAVISGIVDKLKADIVTQKDLDAKSAATAAKVKKVKVSQKTLKAYKGHKIKVTFKRAKYGSKKITSYQIYRKTGKSGTYKRIKTLTSKKSTISYTNKSLKKGKRYYYKVRGVVTLANGSKAYTKFSSAKSIKCR